DRRCVMPARSAGSRPAAPRRTPEPAMMRAQLFAAMLAIALAGCVPAGIVPKLTARVPAPDALAHLAPDVPGGAWPVPDWVASFKDPQLDALAADAVRDNPDLQAARARIDIAQGELQQFASLTGLTATAGATVQKARLP